MSITQPMGGVAHAKKEVCWLTPRSDEVMAFCQRHALESDLAKAEELAMRLFPHVVRIVIELEEDPEDGDQYLVLEVLAKGDEDECFNAHKNYLSDWANSVGWPEVRLIRLTYDSA